MLRLVSDTTDSRNSQTENQQNSVHVITPSEGKLYPHDHPLIDAIVRDLRNFGLRLTYDAGQLVEVSWR